MTITTTPAAATVDPVALVWQALERAGCQPHGQPHDYRGKCPAHHGVNPDALHVSEGSDRRAIVHCFVGCRTEEVVRALALMMRDLFVLGTRNNTRRARPRPGRRGRIEVVLQGCEIVGIRARGFWVLSECPFCSAPGCWLRCSEEGTLDVACSDGCSREDIFNALETSVAIKEAQHGAR